MKWRQRQRRQLGPVRTGPPLGSRSPARRVLRASVIAANLAGGNDRPLSTISPRRNLWSHAAEVALRTPESRNRYVDFLRALSIDVTSKKPCAGYLPIATE